jgi:hypothetical protein
LQCIHAATASDRGTELGKLCPSQSLHFFRSIKSELLKPANVAVSHSTLILRFWRRRQLYNFGQIFYEELITVWLLADQKNGEVFRLLQAASEQPSKDKFTSLKR